MPKTAIFVEGQTELIFAREYLLKSFDYSNISLECYTLFTDNTFHSTEYAFPNDSAEYFFQIINVGNDNAVLSRLLKREAYLWNVGFDYIVGLRDMYSKSYRELGNNNIDDLLNQEFINSAQYTIQSRAIKPAQIHFCFAIMETEAWLLGLASCFEQLNGFLSTEYIKEQLGFDLLAIDPELVFFHPAEVIKAIYNLIGEHYHKSKGDIAALMNGLQKEDFKSLLSSAKCNSFKHFVHCINPA